MLAILGRHVPQRYVRQSCVRDHCHGCDQDEPILAGQPVYVLCIECGHAYRSSAELLAVWLEYELMVPAGVREEWGIGRVPVPPPDAHQIWSCPMCNHDF